MSGYPESELPPGFKMAHDAFLVGNGINDAQLDMLLGFYRNLLSDIDVLGKEFQFAQREIRDRWYRLDGFKRSRNEDKRK